MKRSSSQTGRIPRRLVSLAGTMAMILGVVSLALADFRPCCCQSPPAPDTFPPPCHGGGAPEPAAGGGHDECGDCSRDCHLQAAVVACIDNVDLAPAPSRDATSLQAPDAHAQFLRPYVEAARLQTGHGPPGSCRPTPPSLHTILRI